MSALTHWLSDVDKHDIGAVGARAAELGDLIKAGFPIPQGFVVSSRAYFDFMQENGLNEKITGILSTISYDHPESVMQVSGQIKKLFMESPLSHDITKSIEVSYRRVGGIFHHPPVVVRSSATVPDLPNISLAGHHPTFTNVQGEANLILKIRETWASLFDTGSLISRHQQQIDHLSIAVPVVVQKMINPDASGVMFTHDPLTNDSAKIIIEAVYGLPTSILSGKVTPDHYELFKKDLELASKTVAKQSVMHTYDHGEEKVHDVAPAQAEKQKISDNLITDIALLGHKLNQHHYFPQNITWAIEKKHIYILSAKRLTSSDAHKPTHEKPTEKLAILLKGTPASPGIASGPVQIVHEHKDLRHVTHGAIVVLPHMHTDYAPALKKAGAVITDHGGKTAQASILARHLEIPTIVGTHTATEKLRNGMVVTVNASIGEVYSGAPHSSPLSSLTSQPSTHTRIYVTLSKDTLVEKVAKEHVHGLGLLKGEALMKELSMTPKQALEHGKNITFITELANKLATFSRAFYPRPVLYRFSDTFGLGSRGASHHLHNNELLKLEIEAVKLVRGKLKLHNLGVIIPCVRNVRELTAFKQAMADEGMQRSPTLKIWMMVQTPANVWLIDKYLKAGIDGLIIDTTELAMLSLGIDPAHTDVAHLFDEIDQSILLQTELVIKEAKKHHVPTIISGLAPSLYPSILDHAVQSGVTAVSVSPDVVEATRKHLALFEKKHAVQEKK